MTAINSICFRSTSKICCFLSIVFLFSYSNVFAKTVTIVCPTVKATLKQGYKTTSDGYEWFSWQSQPRIEVSTMNDNTYFSEINQSYKGISLRCIGGSGDKRYGFYSHDSKIVSCKIDSKTNKGFICELKD
jgi:hypothetical protein